MKKEDVRVSVENQVLSISGARKLEKEQNDKKYHRIERAYGRFLRSFTLPETVDATKVNAEFKDGVLKLRLPKTEKIVSKAMQVKIE